MGNERNDEYSALLATCEAQMHLEVCNGCTACALRCASDVPASRAEWEAIQYYIAQTSTDERETINRVLFEDKTVSLGDEVTVQMCRYWNMETQRCVVYPVRPLACRLLGHVEWMPCPIEEVPQPIPTTDALHLMRSYAHFERKTFADWEKEKRQDEQDFQDL